MNSAKSAASMMFAANTVGDDMPPYAIYQAKHLWDTWMVGAPNGTRSNRSKSDWFDMTWFPNGFFTLFLPYCKKLSDPKVLTGDKLSSHISPDALPACQDNNIRFVCSPPNSTHLCHPLDATYYELLKRYRRRYFDQMEEDRPP